MELIGKLSLPALAAIILFYAVLMWVMPFENNPEEPEPLDPQD